MQDKIFKTESRKEKEFAAKARVASRILDIIDNLNVDDDFLHRVFADGLGITEQVLEFIRTGQLNRVSFSFLYSFRKILEAIEEHRTQSSIERSEQLFHEASKQFTWSKEANDLYLKAMTI